VRKRTFVQIDWDWWWMVLLKSFAEDRTRMKRRIDPTMCSNHPWIDAGV